MKESLNVHQTVRLKPLRELPKGFNCPVYDGAECEVRHVYEDGVMVRIGKNEYHTVSFDCIDFEWLSEYRENIKVIVDTLRNQCAAFAREFGNFTIGYTAADSAYKHLFEHPDYLHNS